MYEGGQTYEGGRRMKGGRRMRGQTYEGMNV